MKIFEDLSTITLFSNQKLTQVYEICSLNFILLYKKSILYLGYRIPMNFVYEDDMIIDGSCSVNFRGSMLIFGGTEEYSRQFLRVGDCSLRKEGQLPFDFRNGACETFEQPQIGETALLCFDSYSQWYKDCFTWVVKITSWITRCIIHMIFNCNRKNWIYKNYFINIFKLNKMSFSYHCEMREIEILIYFILYF